MNVGNSVRIAINDWENGELESSLLHACNAIDGTARKRYPNLANRTRFTSLLRDSVDVVEAMGCPGIDLTQTRFPVPIPKPTSVDGLPDFADIIYFKHRIGHAHGDEVPASFNLISDAGGPLQSTRVAVTKGSVRFSDRMIFALISVAVFAPENKDQTIPQTYFLTWNGDRKIIIDEWWGELEKFRCLIKDFALPKVKMDFGEWMHD